MAAVDSFHLLYREVARSCQNHLEIFTAIGACYVTWKGLHVLYKCFSLFHEHVTPCLLSRGSLVRQYGEWAVVTGATEGIGKAYAEELACNGVNIILISHSREKLLVVSESIARTFGVRTSFIEVDFGKGQAVFHSVKEALKDVDVGFLVNSAGVCYEHMESVTQVSEDSLWEIINVNIAAATMMVHIVLPSMIKQKKGAIVNVSCGSYCKSTPQLAVYSASKLYLDGFSQILQSALSHTGIFVQSLIPVCAALSCKSSKAGVHRFPFFIPSPETYARHAVRTLGFSNRTAGYWVHSIQPTDSARFLDVSVAESFIELLFAEWTPNWLYTRLGKFLCL